jgi:hypothetical protein
MKIYRIAKAGEVLDQVHGPKPSGKLDSQTFIGKKDPSHVAREKRTKKKKKKKASCSCSIEAHKKA